MGGFHVDSGGSLEDLEEIGTKRGGEKGELVSMSS